MTQFPDRFQSTPWPPAATDAQKSTNLEMKLTPKLTPAIPSGPVSTRPLKLPRYMQAPHSSARYLPSARERGKTPRSCSIAALPQGPRNSSQVASFPHYHSASHNPGRIAGTGGRPIRSSLGSRGGQRLGGVKPGWGRVAGYSPGTHISSICGPSQSSHSAES